MITGLFRLHLKPGKKSELIEFLKWDGEVARDSEPGTLRFEFYNDPEDDAAIYLYESYRDEAAFEEHKAHAPFQKYVSEVRPACVESADRLLPFSAAIWSPAD